MTRTEVTAVYADDSKCSVAFHPGDRPLLVDGRDEVSKSRDGISPTQLLASSIATCILAILDRIATRHRLDLGNSEVCVSVHKLSETNPRIHRVETEVRLPGVYDTAMRARLEAAAAKCPIHGSLHPDIDSPIRFIYR